MESQALQYMTEVNTMPWQCEDRGQEGVGKHPSPYIYQVPYPDSATYQVLALGHMDLKIKWELLAKSKD